MCTRHRWLNQEKIRNAQTPRRPIPRLRTAVEIVESVLYRRMRPVVEPRLSAAQYAFRRERSTEMRHVEVTATLRRPPMRGRFCFLVPFNIPGAFSYVPHWHLMGGLRDMQIDTHTRSVVHFWPPMRTSRVKMTTPGGTRLSNIYLITRVLLLGAVPSPILWLAVPQHSSGRTARVSRE